VGGTIQKDGTVTVMGCCGDGGRRGRDSGLDREPVPDPALRQRLVEPGSQVLEEGLPAFAAGEQQVFYHPREVEHRGDQ
jgi:hypothetical protein